MEKHPDERARELDVVRRLNGQTMSWDGILRTVQELAHGPESERWPDAVHSAHDSGLFRKVDTRITGRTGIVVLDLDPALDLARCEEALADLGPPIDMRIVSPPVRDPDHPDHGPDWERRHSVCHLVGDRRVWFSVATSGETRELRSIAIHIDE